MKTALSPSQVARALQVSESSVKRWCDQGSINAMYTAGGHRRIAMDALMEFLRASRHQLVDPAIVGLPPGTGDSSSGLEASSERLRVALALGDEVECRRVIYSLFLAEMSVAAICDEVIAAALDSLGTEWGCGNLEVYQERRSCEIVRSITHDLESLIPAPPADADIAIGGGIEGDPYSLASRMVELVLKDAKWSATSLGEGLPWETLHAAIQHEQPRIFWLSISAIADLHQFECEYNHLFEEYGAQVAFVVGGRAVTPEVRQRIKYASFCDTLQHLEQFANTLQNQSRSNT